MALPYRRRPLPGNTTPEANLEWALFDRCVTVGHSAPSSMVAVAKSSNDQEVRVSLRLATPPSISYVQLDTEDCVYDGPPMVVAADGDLLLIHMVVAVDGALRCTFPDNFFVYKADPEWPCLKRLPSVGSNWTVDASRISIFHKGGKEFVVADLNVRVISDTYEIGELLRYSSDDSSLSPWEVKSVTMPYDVDRNFYPLCWETDAVFRYSGFLCWADYQRGFLFCDILAKDPTFSFVQFPHIENVDDWEDMCEGRGFPEMCRTVSVSEEGRLYFIDVDDGRFRRDGKCSGAITVWTLESLPLVWMKRYSVDLTTLWSHSRYKQSPMPSRCMPNFPVVDMTDGSIAYFILQESGKSREHWMITVDMRQGQLTSYTTYKNAFTEPDVKNMFFEIPLLACRLCLAEEIGTDTCVYKRVIRKPVGEPKDILKDSATDPEAALFQVTKGNKITSDEMGLA